MNKAYTVLFLNPRAAKVFQDLAYDLAARWSPSTAWTEVSEIVQFESSEHLIVQNAPRMTHYNRRNYFTRVCSLLSFYIYVFTKLLFNSSKNTLLFFVTTPPFMGLIGWFVKKIKGQKYVMLVYDKYPDVLLETGVLKEGFIARLWRRLDRIALNNADAVITIGEYMAARLAKDCDPEQTSLGHIAVVHNWADVDDIKPLAKGAENPFVRQYGLEGKFLVMYSGNLGATHDADTLIEAAKQLKDHPDIRFVMIGGGAKWQRVMDAKQKYGLENMLILSYLPQDRLPYSLPSADIAVVTIANGIEGCLVPCKFYACLAAGNAMITISNPKCEIADIVRNQQCGKTVALGDVAALKDAILHYYENRESLDLAKRNSRRAAVQKYSRKNTQLYIDVIEKLYDSNTKSA